MKTAATTFTMIQLLTRTITLQFALIGLYALAINVHVTYHRFIWQKLITCCCEVTIIQCARENWKSQR